jgi:hypothetical protein
LLRRRLQMTSRKGEIHMSVMTLSDQHSRLLRRPSTRAVLAHLLEAHDFAEECNCRNDLYSVGLNSLLSAGGLEPAIRWLIEVGHVRHLTDVAHKNGRKAPRNMDNSRFLLTQSGLEVAWHARLAEHSTNPDRTGNSRPHSLPRWNKDTWELWLRRSVIKRFGRPAKNQFLILAAFDESGWPPRIDDPLPRRNRAKAGKQLRNAIGRLNGNRKEALIWFHVESRGIRWELLAEN